MAGGGNNNPKLSSHKPAPPSSHKKSRWESPKNPPSDHKPKPSPNNPTPVQTKPQPQPEPAHPPFPFSEPPPPPAYGFHMLDRRTIVLADGSVRSYFALPPEYDFTPRRNGFLRTEFDNRFHFSPEAAGFRDNREYWNGPGLGPMKRKYSVDEEKERLHFLAYANSSRDRLEGTSGHFEEEIRAAKHMRTAAAGGGGGGGGGGQSLVKHNYEGVDQIALKKAFLHFVKVINENVTQRKSYLDDGKQGRLQCVACRRFEI